jgi:hypothetical protein
VRERVRRMGRYNEREETEKRGERLDRVGTDRGKIWIKICWTKRGGTREWKDTVENIE